MTEAERNALIEQCALAAEQQVKADLGWTGNPGWVRMMVSAGMGVRLLKTRPITPYAEGLTALRQAIIDNTHGDLFWIGEILLNELQKETGYPPKETADIASSADPTGTIKHMWEQIEERRRTSTLVPHSQKSEAE